MTSGQSCPTRRASIRAVFGGNRSREVSVTSHSRWFWGLRVHLVCTLHGLPVGWALTEAKTEKRDVLEDVLVTTPALAVREGVRRTVIADKAYYGRDFEHRLHHNGIDLLRPARAGENPKPQPDCSSPCGRSSSRSTTR